MYVNYCIEVEVLLIFFTPSTNVRWIMDEFERSSGWNVETKMLPSRQTTGSPPIIPSVVTPDPTLTMRGARMNIAGKDFVSPSTANEMFAEKLSACLP